MVAKLLIIFSAFWAIPSESANILAVYPTPSISHQVVFRRVTLELVKQGHNVTVITPDPVYPQKDGPENLKEIDVHDASYDVIRRKFASLPEGEITKELSRPNFFFDMLGEIFEIQIRAPEVQRLLRDKSVEYDLILIEELARPFLGITHVIKAPVILFSSVGASPISFDVFGLQTHPIIYPNAFAWRVYNLSTWEKIQQFFVYCYMMYISDVYMREEQTLLRKHFGADVPEIRELYKNVHMIFLNNYPIWNENQAVPPNIIYLGGLHQLETKELPKDLKNYLDSSKHGVIYVSFGTNALSTVLQMNKIQIIAEALGRLPYDVLWKWDQDTLPGQAKNIKLSKWLPQADLLKHPKIKLFITQAGLQSTDEAITAGVPLLAFPVLADQWYNAEKYERHGIGKKYMFDDINEALVRNAVEEIIGDDRYRANIVNLRNTRNDQPQQPLERAMFWIDHIVRNKGGQHLVPASAHLSWTQYYEVYLVVTALAVALVSSAAMSYVLYRLYKIVMSYVYMNQKIKSN